MQEMLSYDHSTLLAVTGDATNIDEEGDGMGCGDEAGK